MNTIWIASSASSAALGPRSSLTTRWWRMWPSTATDHRCHAHDNGATISLFFVNPLGAHCTLPRNTNIAPSHAHSFSHCHSLTHPPSRATAHERQLHPIVIHSPTITRNHPRPPTASNRHALKPGSYDVDCPVGYYTTVAGLGSSPMDVTFTSPKGVCVLAHPHTSTTTH
jgi:hypothetical protein